MMHVKPTRVPALVSALAVAPLVASCDDDEPEAGQRQETLEEDHPIQKAPPTLPDEQIQQAVQRELFYDPSVGSKDLNVTVSNGIVELTGKVSNLLAQSRARHIASAVKGVRAISDRTQVDLPDRDDDFVKSAVEAALSMDPTTERFDVTTTVRDQVVTLSGTAQSQPERAWAERAARSVIGVKEVKNDIAVEYRANRRDAEIREDVRARLRWDNVINDGLIETHVDDGHVTLTGIIASLAEKERAEDNAWVAGVKSVNTRPLEVEWWAKDDDLRKDKYLARSDREIERAIEDTLLFDPRVNSFTIEPRVPVGLLRCKAA